MACAAARNLLVDEFFRVRVADFGFSRVKDQNQSKGYTASTVGPVRRCPVVRASHVDVCAHVCISGAAVRDWRVHVPDRARVRVHGCASMAVVRADQVDGPGGAATEEVQREVRCV